MKDRNTESALCFGLWEARELDPIFVPIHLGSVKKRKIIVIKGIHTNEFIYKITESPCYREDNCRRESREQFLF